MIERVHLSTMGRPVKLGDWYDYATDSIIPSDSNASSCLKSKELNLSVGTKNPLKVHPSFSIYSSEEDKWGILDLEAHLKASILGNVVPNNFWFSSYLSDCSANNSASLARVTISLRASSRSRKLVEDVGELIESMDNPHRNATHIIEEIRYGFNVIVVFDLPVSSGAEKTETEEQLFLQAKRLFEKLLAGENPSAIVHAQDASLLESATRRIHSDMTFDPAEGAPFVNWLGNLQRAVRFPSMNNFPTVKMVLFPIAYIAPKGHRDLPADSLASLSTLKGILQQVASKWQQLMQDPFLARVPHFFAWLREGFGPFLHHCTETLLGLIRTSVIDYRRSEIASDSISEHLNHLVDGALLEYVLARKRDLSILKSLLDGVDLELKPLQELEVEFRDKNSRVVIFFLKTKQVPDPMLAALQKRFGPLNDPTRTWTCFEITSSGTSQHKLQPIRDQLLTFQAARQANMDMLFFLSASETYQDDGFIVSWNGFPNGPTSTPPLGEEKERKPARPATPGTAIRSESKVKMENSDESMPMEDEQSPKPVTEEVDPEPEEEEMVEVRDSTTYKDIYDKPCDNLRPAEKFARLSELLKKETPSIYLLKASERVTSNKELRWFDIGNPGGGSGAERKPHKVLILMGATGSGKSTLVNGMVNYILGVEWSDPFRFSIVKEEDAATSNQASSQTKGVTAYTIHHAEGMKIDYGLTIIDTPGYGDTGGIERDQEITRIIGRFLSHQQTQSALSFIHAVCFVASSADSRLTPTQHHILESVVSLFGRDVTNSLRLLVTFSDGMKPPVLEAVIAAEIPGLSDKKDGGIQHHKFNNSALYASNVSDTEDEILFDRGYWDLGLKNFHEFFAMLGKMPDRSLEQTLAVIQSRTDLEHTLERIEEQLATSLEKIEDIERFRRKVAQLGSKVEANKNFEVTEFHWGMEKVPCEKGKKAFNCTKCKATCGLHSWNWLQKRVAVCGNAVAGYLGVRSWKLCKTNGLCFCADNDHTLEDFIWEERRTVRTRTLEDMKKEYEMSLGCKMSIEDMLKKREEELESIKQKGVVLLKSLADCLHSLESTALRVKKQTVADYVNLMKSRMEQEKKKGYGTRIKILEELLSRSVNYPHHSVYMNNNNYRSIGRGTLLSGPSVGSYSPMAGRSVKPAWH